MGGTPPNSCGMMPRSGNVAERKTITLLSRVHCTELVLRHHSVGPLSSPSLLKPLR